MPTDVLPLSHRWRCGREVDGGIVGDGDIGARTTTATTTRLENLLRVRTPLRRSRWLPVEPRQTHTVYHPSPSAGRYAPVRTGSAVLYTTTVRARTSARRAGKNNTHNKRASFVRTHKHWRTLHVRPVIVRNSVRPSVSVRSVAVFTSSSIPRVRSAFGLRVRRTRSFHTRKRSRRRLLPKKSESSKSVRAVLFPRTMYRHRGVVAHPWWSRRISSGTFPCGLSTTTINATAAAATAVAAATSTTTTTKKSTITSGQHQRPAVRG